jgi:hypothetical protein
MELFSIPGRDIRRLSAGLSQEKCPLPEKAELIEGFKQPAQRRFFRRTPAKTGHNF